MDSDRRIHDRGSILNRLILFHDQVAAYKSTLFFGKQNLLMNASDLSVLRKLHGLELAASHLAESPFLDPQNCKCEVDVKPNENSRQIFRGFATGHQILTFIKTICSDPTQVAFVRDALRKPLVQIAGVYCGAEMLGILGSLGTMDAYRYVRGFLCSKRGSFKNVVFVMCSISGGA